MQEWMDAADNALAYNTELLRLHRRMWDCITRTKHGSPKTNAFCYWCRRVQEHAKDAKAAAKRKRPEDVADLNAAGMLPLLGRDMLADAFHVTVSLRRGLSPGQADSDAFHVTV